MLYNRMDSWANNNWSLGPKVFINLHKRPIVELFPRLDSNTTSLSVDTIYLNPALGTWTFEQLQWVFENNGASKCIENSSKSLKTLRRFRSRF